MFVLDEQLKAAVICAGLLPKFVWLATGLYEAARLHLPGKHLRTDYTDGAPDLEADFYILRHTQPAAVLVENFFMGSKEDCRFLLSEEGKQAIVDLHVDGICRYLRTK